MILVIRWCVLVPKGFPYFVLFSILVHTAGWREALNHLILSPPTFNNKHRLQFPTMTKLIDLKIQDRAVPADCSLQAADLQRRTHTTLYRISCCISHTASHSHIKSLLCVHVCVQVCFRPLMHKAVSGNIQQAIKLKKNNPPSFSPRTKHPL